MSTASDAPACAPSGVATLRHRMSGPTFACGREMEAQASRFGGALNRLADETGGMAFLSGFTFVSFEPYLKELRELLGRQWLVSYRSTGTAPGFRKIKVTTQLDLHLHYPEGYEAAR